MTSAASALEIIAGVEDEVARLESLVATRERLMAGRREDGFTTDLRRRLYEEKEHLKRMKAVYESAAAVAKYPRRLVYEWWEVKWVLASDGSLDRMGQYVDRADAYDVARILRGKGARNIRVVHVQRFAKGASR